MSLRFRNAWWLAGGAKEFQATTIEAEIEFVAFLRHRRYRLCCVMPIPFFFFSNVPNTKQN